MDGFPITYKGFDGVEYCATYKTGKPVARISIERTDGFPIVVKGAAYPCGYIAGYGDLFAANFLNSLKGSN